MIHRALLALVGTLLLALPSAAVAHDPRNDRPKRSKARPFHW